MSAQARVERSSTASAPVVLALTEREQQVLPCLVRGCADQQVADDLDKEASTSCVVNIRAIDKRLQVHSVAEAVSRALGDTLV